MAKCTVKDQRKPGISLQESSPSRVIQDALHYFSIKLMTGEGCLPTMEAHQRLYAKGFYWGMATQAPFAQHTAKFYTPGEKEVCVSHVAQSVHCEPLDHCRALFTMQVLMPPKGQTLSRPFEGQLSQACYINCFLLIVSLQSFLHISFKVLRLMSLWEFII